MCKCNLMENVKITMENYELDVISRAVLTTTLWCTREAAGLDLRPLFPLLLRTSALPAHPHPETWANPLRARRSRVDSRALVGCLVSRIHVQLRCNVHPSAPRGHLTSAAAWQATRTAQPDIAPHSWRFDRCRLSRVPRPPVDPPARLWRCLQKYT
jgi:hypothetical protein